MKHRFGAKKIKRGRENTGSYALRGQKKRTEENRRHDRKPSGRSRKKEAQKKAPNSLIHTKNNQAGKRVHKTVPHGHAKNQNATKRPWGKPWPGAAGNIKACEGEKIVILTDCQKEKA